MANEESMRCMEVWGGNGSRNSHLARPGLDVWLSCDARSCPEAGGGDLHLLSSCASGRITRMLLADICGIGPVFGSISDELRELMKRNVNKIKQARAVRELGYRLNDAAGSGGFASTLISTYFAPTRSFSLCNAGHPPPMLYRANSANWTFLKKTAPVEASVTSSPGVLSPRDYQVFDTKLNHGDLVLSYSNSLTECRTASGATIGLSGLIDFVEQLDPSHPDQIGTKLVERLRGEHAENLQEQDATILLCRATSTPVTWRDNLLAPFRLLRSATDNTNFR